MEFIKYETLEGVTKITIDKAKSLNALNKQVLTELDEVLSTSDVKSSRVVTITGGGDKAFVAGADISEMKEFTSIQAKEFSDLGHNVFLKLERLKAVTISLVNGFALGGGFELALSTDIILATQNSKFGLPEVGLGLIPGFGGTQRLSRSAGTHFAKALTLSADMVSADLLFEKGLVYKVLESKEELAAVSDKLTKNILKKGPHALSVAKRTIQSGAGLKLSEALTLEKQEFALLFGTKETEEGVSAFLEKRAPDFK